VIYRLKTTHLTHSNKSIDQQTERTDERLIKQRQ
jgi:hypothetical protein